MREFVESKRPRSQDGQALRKWSSSSMWSLSLPQVAATLAAALAAYETKNSAGQRLINEPVLNSVIVMMVVTSILGPILAEVFGKRLPEAQGLQIAEGEPSAAVATGA